MFEDMKSMNFLCHICGGTGRLTGVSSLSCPISHEVICPECGNRWMIEEQDYIKDNIPNVKVKLTENADGTVSANYIPLVTHE